jgi:hypothetical protein
MDHLLLAVAIAATGVKGVEIDHVRNDISYRSALDASDVAERATVHVASQDPQKIHNVVTAIRATGARADATPADLRYVIRLRDAHGTTTAIIYLDAFGRRGLVDGQPVRFADDAIKRAITAAFPALYK